MVDSKENVTNVTEKRQKEEKIKTILESLEKGVSIVKACKTAGTTTVTFWRWRKKSKKLDDKVLAIFDSRTQTVEDALFMNTLKGNVVAQIFWLKNRGKGRWKDKFEHDINEHKVILLGKKEKPEDEVDD